jgi:hypothetical protein
MPKYRLLSQHFSEEDKLLEIGTEVGDGTSHKWTRPPSPEMEGLDDESKALVIEERERAGPFGLEPLNGLQMVGGQPGDITPVPIMNHPGIKRLT